MANDVMADIEKTGGVTARLDGHIKVLGQQYPALRARADPSAQGSICPPGWLDFRTVIIETMTRVAMKVPATTTTAATVSLLK